MTLLNPTGHSLTGISCILFDMDGTLLDSAPGVTASAARALAAVGAPVPALDQLRRFVGPPMIESFRTVSQLDEKTAQKALQHYRKSYADHGAEQSGPCDGILDLLEQLHSAGAPMAVATSKVEDQAIRLARRFGMEGHFINVCGASDAEGRSSKADVIAELLLRLQSDGVDTSSPVMVGDRSYDVAGAATHGIPTIFALWGYGDAAEASHAAAVAPSPAAVLPLILNNAEFLARSELAVTALRSRM
ncbi:HAD hydrolase-like protein [Pseudarthrobacter sp. MM222]|uniref:HAD hydrolase-like protein n=1 Tax=Pseudarthrobacter sp. MM222 TaxID=3018929 RepID=UPI00221F1F29|nr:HAD hydrolase-like protein [Pseudarthrobacter sp. MM222]CAI3791017.1 Phosphoglycolate phosphatase [Pseudarthrobacter sp. MM222]